MSPVHNMDNLTNNVKSDLLSQTYNGSIERIVKLEDEAVLGFALRLSSDVLEERKEFWTKLFLKYSKDPSDELDLDLTTLDVVRNDSPYKSSNFVQHWVNTGTLPCNQWDIGHSLHLQHNRIIQGKSNDFCVTPSCDGISSSSSVDTAAYILSNTNVTNKEETMAIVEGARNNIPINFQNIVSENTEVPQITQNESVVVDNNGNNNEKHITQSSETMESVVQQHSADLNKRTIPMQANTDRSFDSNILFSPVSRNNKSVQKRKLHYNELFGERLNNIINDSRKMNSYIKQSLLSGHLSGSQQSFFADENITLDDNTLKLGQRKKLYSGTDSPVDLTHTRSSNKFKQFSPKMNLHPALVSGSKFRQFRICKKRRLKRISMFERGLINNSQVNSSNFGKCKRTRKTQEYFIKTSSNSNVQKNHDSFSNVKEYRKKESGSSDSMRKKSENLNPVVYLTRLSELHIQKHISKERGQSLQNLQPQVLSENLQVGFCKSKQSSKVVRSLENVSPVVRLTRLSHSELQKYNKSCTKITNFENLNPVVRLTRLAHSDLQKYNKLCTKITNFENLSPVLCSKPLSKTENKKFQAAGNAGTSNVNKVSQNSQVQNNSKSATQLLAHNALKYRNSPLGSVNAIDLEDKDSYGSTLLLYSCTNSVTDDHHSTSNVSDSTANNCQGVSFPCNNTSKKVQEKLNKMGRKLDSRHTHTSLKSTVMDILPKQHNRNVCEVEKEQNFNGREQLYAVTSQQSQQKKLKDNEQNSECENVFSGDNREIRRTHDTMDTAEYNIKNLEINSAEASGKVLASSESNESKLVYNKNDKKRLCQIFELSDEDDEFVKFIEKSQNDSMSMIEEDDNRNENLKKTKVIDAASNRMQCLASTSIVESKSKRLRSTPIYQGNDTGSRIYNKVRITSLVDSSEEEDEHTGKAQNCSLPIKRNHNNELNRTKSRIQSQKKVLLNRNCKNREGKRKINHLCFQTKIFDSDSESASLLSNKS